MKEIFRYTLNKIEKTDVTETLPNGDKIIKSVNKEIPVTVVIGEPSRKNLQDAKDAYNIELSRLMSLGVITRAVMDKKYRAENGIFTPAEIKSLDEINKRIREIRAEYAVLEKVKDKSVEDNKKIDDLLIEFSNIQNQLNELETVNESLFSSTAESLAKEKEILYNILFLSYVEENGKILPLVNGETLEERLEQFDNILDKGDEKAKLYSRILDRNGYFINLLSRGKIETTQLKALNDQFDESERPSIIEEPPKEIVSNIITETETQSENQESVLTD